MKISVLILSTLFCLNLFAENPKAILKTSLGNVTIELYADKTPKTVENFVKLTKKKYFDGIIFHRVIKNFMSQTGDPTGTGSGGPGYTFEDEFHPDLKHDAEGIVSMANRGPDTNGSQFFIIRKPQPHLDNRHAVFGKVVKGIDVTRKINDAKTKSMDKPIEDIKIKSITLEGNHSLVINSDLLASLEKKAEQIVQANFNAIFPGAPVAEIELRTVKCRGINFLLIWDVLLGQQKSVFWLKGEQEDDLFKIIETHFNLVD